MPVTGSPSQVRLVDVAPTLLSMLSLPLPPTFQGESLVPLMKASQKKADDLPAYAETDYPHRAFGWSALRSMRTGKYLFVRAPKRELYDETHDKAAEHNLAATSPAVTDTLQAQLDEFHRQDQRAITRNQKMPSPTQSKRRTWRRWDMWDLALQAARRILCKGPTPKTKSKSRTSCTRA